MLRHMMLSRKIVLLVSSISVALSSISSSHAQMATLKGVLPDKTPAHYNHRAWRLVDGAPPDIWAFAHAPDGFLWLGTGSGIYRFDGMLFEEILPKSGQFPSSNATALLITTDGTVWIGYFTGEISRLQGHRLKNFDHSDSAVEQFALERDGMLWAARSGPGGGLFRFDGDRWRKVAAETGNHDTMAYSVIAARDGALWVATERHILVRRHGAARFDVAGTHNGIARLAQAPDGQIWVSGNVRPAGRAATIGDELAVVPFSSSRAKQADRMMFSRDGALWQTTFGGGVTRMGGLSKAGSDPLIENFTAAEGLTSPVAVPLLEDREGNIWVGTNLGLNRLRPVNAVTALRVASGVTRTFEMTATTDGAVYVASVNKLYRATPGGSLELVRALPDEIEFVEGDGEDVIIGQGRRVLRLANEGLSREPVPLAPGVITSWNKDKQGKPWITADTAGTFRLTAEGWRAADMAGRNAADEIIFSHSDTGNGHWLYAQDQLFRRDGADFSRVARGHPRIGHVTRMSDGSAGLLIGGELGLARLKGDRFETIGIARVPVLRGISGIVQTGNCDVWINGVRGLLRTSCADLAKAFADRDEPLRYRYFNAADGLPGVAQQNVHGSTLARGGDGRIWVANNVGVGWIDPARLITNRLPPPVMIRSLEANGEVFLDLDQVSLRAGTDSVRIVYTALSLAASETLRFRYRLLGVDPDWVDAGTRREAFYANLPPGEWRFQVIAANNDGMWNRQGDALTILIAPKFYETGWFQLLCLLVLLALAWIIYVWRVREHRSRERDRVEAQLGERERIARELHDTLLQGVQGLILRFQAAANAMKPGSEEYRLAEGALDRADDLVLQARDRVQGLRTLKRTVELVPFLEEIAARYRSDGLNVSITADNRIESLAPECAEQILAIVEEALANTLRHAEASEVAIDARSVGRQLIIGILDDGRGFPADLLAGKGVAGHFGIQGMRERAALLGGTLGIENTAGKGAFVEVRLPLTG